MSELGCITGFGNNDWREDAKERIIRVLENRSDIDEIEYGELVADALTGCCGQVIFAHGQFWAYSPFTGLYHRVEKSEVRKLLYGLHGAQGHQGNRHRLKLATINRIVGVAADHLTDQHFFDNPPPGIATEDGFLLLQGQQVASKDHDPKYRARCKIPIAFNPVLPNEQKQLTEQRLSEILGSYENTQTFLEVLGASLLGLGTHFGKLLVFVGDGANGKSALVDIMCMLLPAELRSSVPLPDMKTDYLRGQLDGKRLNTCEEFPPLSNIDLQYVKNVMTGGDIQARQVSQKAFTMRPIAQHVVCTNHLPKLSENNEALRRRLIVIRLDRIIPENERDPNFAQNIFAEHKEALLVLAVRAAENALTRKYFSEPAASKREVNAWLSRSDSVKSFLNERVLITADPIDRVSATDMFQAAVDFAQENELPPPSSSKDLANRLKIIGMESKKSNGNMVWIGARLIPTPREDREG